MVNTIIRLDLGNYLEQIEARSLWDISYKLFIRLMWHVFRLKEISAAILVANRKSNPDHFFDTIGEFLDLLPISDYCVPKKNYKDVEVLLDVMANNHISFVEFIYNKGGEGKYGDINQMFRKIKEKKLQLPVFNYVSLFDEAVNEKFITYNQKEFTTIVDVVCYKTELIIKGFCSKGEEELLNQKLQRDLERIISYII